MTPAPTTQRWVASHDSGRRAARAFLALNLRRPPVWIYLGVLEVGFAVVLCFSLGDVGAAGRVVWSLLFALVPALVVGGLGLGIGHAANRRAFSRRLREGAAFESELGQDAVTLRGPTSTSTVSFYGIDWARSHGGWVFVRQVGVPLVSAWPVDLFPPADLARLQQASGDGRGR